MSTPFALEPLWGYEKARVKRGVVVNEPNQETLGSVVRRLRQQNGLSQEALAKRAGISQTTIDKIEQGNIKRSRYLINIAKALDVPIHVLDPSYREDPPLPEKENAHTVFQQVRNFDIADKASEYDAGTYNFITLFPTNGAYFEKLDSSLIAHLGLFVVGSQPVAALKRPFFVHEDTDAYCLYVSEKSMSPEFEPGDIAFIRPLLPPIPGTTCVFYGDQDFDQMAFIGHLLKDDTHAWYIKKWGTGREDTLPKTAFTRVHRIVGRQMR